MKNDTIRSILAWATAILAAGAITASAQTNPPTPPYSLFQQAVLTGSGNTIAANWIPVVTATGTVYANLILQFDVNPSGNLTVTAGYPQQTQAPAALVTAFVPGRYVSPGNVNNGKGIIAVSGPGITVGGVTMWSLATTPDANGNTFPSSATWYTGPIDNNPVASRLKKAGIISPFYSYGTLGTNRSGNTWIPNGLIGVSQVGNTITILSFTDSGNVDHGGPVDQITYTLQPN